MKETPLLMCGPMVIATIEGRKTQTRRVIKPQPEPLSSYFSFDSDRWLSDRGQDFYCPYGVPGDRLWVKETFLYRAQRTAYIYKADLEPAEAAGVGAMYGGWKPSIFMPREASRITLELTDVRVERVQEISYADCVAEGVEDDGFANDRYEFLWNSLNAKRDGDIYAWAKNPWVWVLTFRKLSR